MQEYLVVYTWASNKALDICLMYLEQDQSCSIKY